MKIYEIVYVFLKILIKVSNNESSIVMENCNVKKRMSPLKTGKQQICQTVIFTKEHRNYKNTEC